MPPPPGQAYLVKSDVMGSDDAIDMEEEKMRDGLDEDYPELDAYLRFRTPAVASAWADHAYPALVGRMRVVGVVTSAITLLLMANAYLAGPESPYWWVADGVPVGLILLWMVWNRILPAELEKRYVHAEVAFILFTFMVSYGFRAWLDGSLVRLSVPMAGRVFPVTVLCVIRVQRLHSMVALVGGLAVATAGNLVIYMRLSGGELGAGPFLNVVVVAMSITYGVVGSWSIEFFQRSQFLLARRVELKRALIQMEKKRKQDLLWAVLPKPIAARLESEPVIADFFPEATVCFAGIYGFSAHSTTDMVSKLNAIIGQFDALCDKHGLEKIKTIGKVFMCAGGIPVPADDHDANVVDFALDVMALMPKISARLGMDLHLKVGLHTGSVVGGVIGKSKFTYDVWGDTVNVASRMKDAAGVDAIFTTETVFRRLDHRYIFQQIGMRPVKGKGEVMIYRVVSRREETMAPLEAARKWSECG